jgi:hypothetical protein
MVQDDWAADPEDESRALRTLLEVKLFDVSPVTYPAYPDATSGLRALEAAAERRGLDVATVDALLPKAAPVHVRKYAAARAIRNRAILKVSN